MSHTKLLEDIKLNKYVLAAYSNARFSSQCGLFDCKRRKNKIQYFLWLVIESQSTLKSGIQFYVVEDIYAKKNDQKIFIWTSHDLIGFKSDRAFKHPKLRIGRNRVLKELKRRGLLQN